MAVSSGALRSGEVTKARANIVCAPNQNRYATQVNSSLRHRIFETKNFRFPFYYEKKPNVRSEMWKINLQKIVGNLLLIRWASKIVHKWNSHLEFFRRPQVIEYSFRHLARLLFTICPKWRACLQAIASPNIYFTENSRWVTQIKNLWMINSCLANSPRANTQLLLTCAFWLSIHNFGQTGDFLFRGLWVFYACLWE